MILKNTSIYIKNSIFKIKKDKCLKHLILNPFRYSEVISQSKLIGGRYTSAQTVLARRLRRAVWAWTRSGRGQGLGVDNDQGQGTDAQERQNCV